MPKCADLRPVLANTSITLGTVSKSLDGARQRKRRARLADVLAAERVKHAHGRAGRSAGGQASSRDGGRTCHASIGARPVVTALVGGRRLKSQLPGRGGGRIEQTPATCSTGSRPPKKTQGRAGRRHPHEIWRSPLSRTQKRNLSFPRPGPAPTTTAQTTTQSIDLARERLQPPCRSLSIGGLPGQ